MTKWFNRQMSSENIRCKTEGNMANPNIFGAYKFIISTAM